MTMDEFINLLVTITLVEMMIAIGLGVTCAELVGVAIASLAAGGLLGGPGSDNRKTMALTTSLRNVGVSLVIATGGIFAGTPAGPAVLVYGWVEIFGSLLLALGWGRRPSGTPLGEETKRQAFAE
jgi:BASS family bile acid:Na+ symporter